MLQAYNNDNVIDGPIPLPLNTTSLCNRFEHSLDSFCDSSRPSVTATDNVRNFFQPNEMTDNTGCKSGINYLFEFQ